MSCCYAAWYQFRMTWWYGFSTDLPDTGWTIGAESRAKSRWKLNWAFFWRSSKPWKLATVRPTSSKSAIMPKAMAKTSSTLRYFPFWGCPPTSPGTSGQRATTCHRGWCSWCALTQTCPTTRQQIHSNPKTALREAEPWLLDFGKVLSSFVLVGVSFKSI